MSNDRRSKFREACNFVVPFGKHKGKTLNQVAETAEGLTYLDWMRGLGNLYPDTRQAIETFLSEPAVARDLELALAEKEERQPR